ncbi:MAG: deacetylase [Burkholderiales bacterium]|jgi:hypothetical protein|nr:deacetylase [Burkholderiales bacterium]
MHSPFFIITIDTEGDNLWKNSHRATTRNAMYLDRFQRLCERFDFKPVYLVNYEMANDPVFQAFGRRLVANATGEIGAHIHAWNNPPLINITDDDRKYKPYLIEYPDEVMREKFSITHHLLESVFQTEIVSHRAGRWAFDSRYAKLLTEFGYRVDCSVTPEVDWRSTLGHPAGTGGSHYRAFPKHAYFMNLNKIDSVDPSSPLLEVPMTTRLKYHPFINGAKKILARLRKKEIRASVSWLRPNRNNLSQMQRLAARCLAEPETDYLEFMLHSSELMPGGSPTFHDEADIENLYCDLEILFADIKQRCRSATLREYARYKHDASA